MQFVNGVHDDDDVDDTECDGRGDDDYDNEDSVYIANNGGDDDYEDADEDDCNDDCNNDDDYMP